MHDEACTHYVSMIENTGLGHRFLKEELDYIPRVGWQVLKSHFEGPVHVGAIVLTLEPLAW